MSGVSAEVIWHDVECGSYAADLPLWEELTAAAAGPVLELGCGTGRVVLHLGRRGHRAFGLDADAELLAALAERGAGLQIDTVHADARAFALEEPVALVLAPTHLVQLLDGPAERRRCLECVAASLAPGGLFAASIIEAMPPPDDSPPPLPDVTEVDGWIYSSLAVEAEVRPDAIVVHRLRQTVSPEGRLEDEPNLIRIETFPASRLEQEGSEVGLRPAGRVEIPATDLHVGSLVVLLRKEG